MGGPVAIGEYLIQRLQAYGVGHVFGIPGDYVLGFYDLLEASPLRIVSTCDEAGAGFAADGYARINGLGVCCITYCVGGLKVVNPVAGAYAEKSPVVVISGAPGMREREKNPLLHHKVREFDTQKRVFEEVTVASAVLDNARTACEEIDRVLHAAVRYKRPVYLELPRDMVTVPGYPAHAPAQIHEASDPLALEEAVSEAVALLNAAKKPVILADVEIHRFGLQDELVRLAQRAQIPVASTILGKSVISEQHALYLGVYEGAMGREEVRKYVEDSDCVLMLGVFMTDINLGVYTARLDVGRSIYATSEKLAIRHHNFENVRLKDFMRALIAGPLRVHQPGPLPGPAFPGPYLPGAPEAPVRINRLFERLNAFIDEQTVVVADVGDALFGGSELFIHNRTEFLGPAYYASMGFAVPAGLGVQMARPDLRAVILVGDGAFQMTGMELSTIARYGLDPVIVVLNNAGYGTERQIHDGPYNDIHPWNFAALPAVFGGGQSFDVRTEGDLEAALKAAQTRGKGYCLLDVHLDPADHSPALARLGERLGKRV